MLEYKYFTGPPDHRHFHSDHLCDGLTDLWGDMTPDVAIRAAVDKDDLDPCPKCILNTQR